MTGVTLCSAVSAITTIVVNPAAPLPLFLTSFNGKKVFENILLEWTTEHELQTDRFEIERSNNGSSFNKTGVVNAKGSGSLKNSYNFLDVNPADPINYYRLKMIDADGKFTYSNVLAFARYQSKDISITNVSPNPFTEKINFNIILTKGVPLNLQLVDITGRVIFTKSITGKAGSNVIEWKGLSKLAKGIYYLKVDTPDTILEQKILKVD